MINLKKPEFVQRLTIKRIFLTLGGVAVVVAGLGVAGFMIFSGGDDNQTPDQKFSLNKNNKVDVNLNKEISTLVINQNNESDGNSNLNNMQNIISGQSQQYSSNNLTDSITSNQSGIGTFQKPLGSVVDTSYLNNQPIDLSKLSDQDLEDYYRKQNGLKIVKVASYNAYVAPDGTTPYVDNNQQTNSQNQNLNTPTQNNQNGTTNPILGYDRKGNAIYGYTKDGQPIYGFDKKGQPILTPLNKVIGYTKDGQPIYGYDANGNAILSKDGKSNSLLNSQNQNQNNLNTDKNGNIIYGYTREGKPIYGYDENGKPILTPLSKVVGYTKDGQPIYGYDENGNPILSKKGVSIDNIASVGRLGNSSVPALNENLSNSNGNNANTPIVSNSNGKSNVLNNLGKGSPSVSINSETSNNTGAPPVQTQQSQEVDKTSPLVSLSFKDIKPNNGFVSYNEDGTTQESKPLNSNVSESSTNTNDNKQQLSQKRQMLTNKFTIRAGDYIPAILQTGINSDLPGSISARVSENVYDTATGRYLLIPQGSKLLGAYSANIQYGQERILAAWNELIYPDGSIVMLNNQPGTDLAGFAGFNDQVNNHYWSLFGNTFILSVLTTGLGYSQNNNSNSQNGSGFNQQLSANTGQMMGQAASTILQKSINIAPTLTIRNGYRMNILLTQDVVLDSPYKLIYYK
jgi:type IV secretory pathway VirB10-like protein